MEEDILNYSLTVMFRGTPAVVAKYVYCKVYRMIFKE